MRTQNTTASPTHGNLFAALRAAFPEDLDAVAVETDNGLLYSWRDLDRATAMMANLLESLDLPRGSRIAVQVGTNDPELRVGMSAIVTIDTGYERPAPAIVRALLPKRPATPHEAKGPRSCA